ncbi:MAG: IS1 family transposase [Alphaproteobacteria bacterium]|nr:IS1 family transposase [Alphaproteobacteria bacterium]
MVKCRYCGCKELSKDGIIKGIRRYKCKRCEKTTRENDQRYKYSISTRLRVLKGYLEGGGIMVLERLTGVPNPLIIKWIRNYAKILGE